MSREEDDYRPWIDGMAKRFEQSWKGPGQPLLELYLAELEAPRRSLLLEELLKIELKTRRDRRVVSELG
jgi:hypothetical protein